MARPEHMAGIGYQLMHTREGIRAALLSNIYQLVTPHLSEDDANEFSVFYREMLVGMDAQAREAGAQPKSMQDLKEFIYVHGEGLPEGVKTICLALMRLMEPPEPLNL